MIDKTSLMLRLAAPKRDSSDAYVSEYKELAGITGELITRKFLDHWNTQYFHIEQNNGSKPQWLANGKRPDFVAFTSDPTELVLIDAKFHIPDKNKFSISNSDLKEYTELVNKLSENGRTVNLIFTFPVGGNSINSFYCYTLDEFLGGDNSEDGCSKVVSLTNPLNALKLEE